jgi:hypothetical protein
MSNFCSSLDGIWTHTIDTLQHQSLSLMSSALDHIYIYIYIYHAMISLLSNASDIIMLLILFFIQAAFVVILLFGTVSTVWFILEQFRQCGLFWNSFDSVVYFGTVSRVWFILLFILFQIYYCVKPFSIYIYIYI